MPRWQHATCASTLELPAERLLRRAMEELALSARAYTVY